MSDDLAPSILKTDSIGHLDQTRSPRNSFHQFRHQFLPSLKADLHSHSHYSDGKHAPRFLRDRALELGLTHLAITDHDCLAALDELESTPELSIVPGLEISCQWQQREIHVVGLCVARNNPALQQLVANQQARRRERLQAMALRLEKLGIQGLTDYLSELPCHAQTRTHVADFLVGAGYCKNHQKAFKQYLGKRGKIHVPASWCDLADAVAAIRGADGIAVLAHPGRYPLSRGKLGELVSDFVAVGGEALEVSYSNIDPTSRRQLTTLALETGLWTSQGSDFHDQAAHWTDLGKFPDPGPDAKKNAIWLHPRWHSSDQTFPV